MCVHAKSLQSCPTLCDLMDWGPPGSSAHGILQAGTLECVAISCSRGSSRRPRDWTQVSRIAGRFFTAEPPGKLLRMGETFYKFPHKLHILRKRCWWDFMMECVPAPCCFQDRGCYGDSLVSPWQTFRRHLALLHLWASSLLPARPTPWWALRHLKWGLCVWS